MINELYQKKKKSRLLFMKEAYEIAKGSSIPILETEKIFDKIMVESEIRLDILLYLSEEGLIKFVTTEGELANLTHSGVKEMEYSLFSPSEETEYFPALNIILNQNNLNIDKMENSQVQQGNTNSSQSIEIKNNNIDDLTGKIEKFMEKISISNISNDEKEDALETLIEIKEEVKSQSPKRFKLKQALTYILSLKPVFEKSSDVIASLTDFKDSMSSFIEKMFS